MGVCSNVEVIRDSVYVFVTLYTVHCFISFGGCSRISLNDFLLIPGELMTAITTQDFEDEVTLINPD